MAEKKRKSRLAFVAGKKKVETAKLSKVEYTCKKRKKRKSAKPNTTRNRGRNQTVASKNNARDEKILNGSKKTRVMK